MKLTKEQIEIEKKNGLLKMGIKLFEDGVANLDQVTADWWINKVQMHLDGKEKDRSEHIIEDPKKKPSERISELFKFIPSRESNLKEAHSQLLDAIIKYLDELHEQGKI